MADTLKVNPTTGELDLVNNLVPLGRTLFVSPSGNNATAVIGGIDKPYQTIQGAISASTSGDTIIVFAGTYTENLTISTKSLSFYLYDAIIIGNHSSISGSTNIEMFGKSEFRSATNANVLYLTGAPTTHRVRGGRITQNFNGIALWFEGGNQLHSIDDCIITGNTNTDLVELKSSNCKVNNCIIINSGSGACVELAGTNFTTVIYNSRIINTHTTPTVTARAIASGNINGTLNVYNSYIRSNKASVLRLSTNSPIISFYDCDLIANESVVFSTVNSAYTLFLQGNFIYGVDCIDRGIGTGTTVQRIESFGNRYFATTGEIVINVPTTTNRYAYFENDVINKAFTGTQLADATYFIPNNVFTNTNMLITNKNLTLTQ